MGTVDAWPGLCRAAACGPFFDLVRWDGDGPAAVELGWQPMTTFADHPLGLTSRVNSVRESLLTRGFGGAGASPAVAVRVAASVTFLGLAARLLSPALGSAVTAGVVPDLGWDRLHWYPAAVGVLPLAVGPVLGRQFGPAGRAPGSGSESNPDSDSDSDSDSDDDARILVAAAIGPVLALGDVVANRYRVPRRILAGNVASALVGAVAAAGRGRPMADDVLDLVTDVLADGELAGTGTFVRPTYGDPRSRFRRRSCCLLYRVNGAAPCGDCVLHDRSATPRG